MFADVMMNDKTNKIPLPRDRGAWQGPEMSFPILSFRCAAGGARRETVANFCGRAMRGNQGGDRKIGRIIFHH